MISTRFTEAPPNGLTQPRFSPRPYVLVFAMRFLSYRLRRGGSERFAGPV
jgi:hypothetical protein